MITMTDIAKKAGVSQATVSRVLNGSSSVSLETKALVMEWVRKLDFQPNQSAKSLASKRTHLIGLVLPDLLNPYFTEIIYHIEKIAAFNGFNILFCNSDGSAIREQEIFKSLKSRQVEGLLIGFTSQFSPVVEDIRNSNIETVVITQASEYFSSVAASHSTGGEIAARHLIERGCSQFVFQGAPDDEKYCGFFKELCDNGFSSDDIDIIYMEYTWIHTTKKAYVKAFEYIENDSSDGKVGVFAVNDFAALGFIHAASDLNRNIPDKYSVIGFDDTYLCQIVRPALTSISQPKEDIGRLSINMLLDNIIKREKGPTDYKNLLLAPSLVKRGTT